MCGRGVVISPKSFLESCRVVQGSISLEQMNSPRSSQTEVDRFGRELSRNNECSMIVLAELAEVISASRVVPRRITFVSVETKVFLFFTNMRRLPKWQKCQI